MTENRYKIKPMFEADSSLEVSILDTENFINILDKYKALVIRSNTNGNAMSLEEFGALVSKNLSLEKYPYIGGAAPRRVIMSDEVGDAIVNLKYPLFILYLIAINIT